MIAIYQLEFELQPIKQSRKLTVELPMMKSKIQLGIFLVLVCLVHCTSRLFPYACVH